LNDSNGETVIGYGCPKYLAGTGTADNMGIGVGPDDFVNRFWGINKIRSTKYNDPGLL
jgi:hypothetical protein